MSEQPNVQLTLLNERLSTLHGDVTEMKDAMRALATAITKLALIEERQAHAAAAQERAFTALEKVEARVSALEAHVPANKRISVWIDRGMLFSFGVLVTYVLKKSGLM